MTVPPPAAPTWAAVMSVSGVACLALLSCSGPEATNTAAGPTATASTSGANTGFGSGTTGSVGSASAMTGSVVGGVATGTTAALGLTSTGGAAGVTTLGTSVTGSATGTPLPGVDLSEELYSGDNFPRFDVTLPQTSIDALRRVTGPDDPLKATYVTGSLEYNGQRVDNIGVRLKGEGSFRSIDDKAALKLKFDSFVDNQEFYGLRRLTLNNMVEDPSFLAERLAYVVFRAAQLPAPRCNSATLYVNGEYYGVYANVEAEDKTFLSRWFQSNDGNLYEEGQVDFEPGNESVFDLETNTTVNDRSDLVALIAAIAGAGSATLLGDLDAVLDTSQFLRFTAAEAAVNQWDMYAYTVFWPNNFRIYNDPTSGKFVFLPWGMDLSMKPYRDSGKPHIGIFEVSHQYDRNQGPVSAGRLFLACLDSPGCRQAYAAEVGEIAGVYESIGLEALATSYHAQIEQAVLSDPKKDYTQSQIQAGYQSLLSTVRERPAAMRADLAAM